MSQTRTSVRTFASLRAACGLLVLGLASPAVVGCSSGGHGELDNAPQVKGSVLGPNSTLEKLTNLQYERPNSAAILQITGLRVSVVDTFDETGTGSSSGTVYLQEFSDKPGPYQGILAFKPTFSPPTFRTSVGDVVDASRQYSDFEPAVLVASNPNQTIPELAANLSLRFDAPYIPIVPVEIPLSDLTSYETGRQWMSMLVTLKNVPVYKALSTSSGRSTIPLDIGKMVNSITLPTITNELFDLAGEQLPLDTGSVVTVTGIVTWFGNFHVAPRSKADIIIVKP